MTPSKENIFRVTGLLGQESTGPLTKANDAELWCFLWSAPKNGGTNNRDAGDLRRHCDYYDVTVMITVRLVPLSPAI